MDWTVRSTISNESWEQTTIENDGSWSLIYYLISFVYALVHNDFAELMQVTKWANPH